MPPEWLALAHVIVANTPRLDGAACRNMPGAFDIAGRWAHYDAPIAVCRSCPARLACHRWASSLEPWQQPSGVVAGQLIPLPRGSLPTGRRRTGRPPQHRPAA